jgi:capsular exopolysaccharide synthesis family protein
VIAAQAAATSEASRTSLQAERDGLASQIGLLSAQVAQVEGAREARVGQVVQPADQPREPSSPKPARNGILALIVGLALGVGAAFFAERLDDRFRGPEGLEISAGAPVLSVIPRMPAERTADGMLVTIRHPDSAHAEAYRTLRTGLMFAASGRSARTMVVTSPLAGDGKTVTTANLGIAIAQAGKRVVLVSADLRKPDLHRLFGWENGPGLTDVLSKRANVWELLVRPEGIDNLWVLQSGSGLGTPADLLSSHEMAELLTQLRDSADVVLIDTGPVLAVPDALSLGPLVDGMLIVVSADQTTRGAVRQARRQLELVNARILGAVLNNFRARKRSGYYHEYGPSRRDAATPAAPSEGTNP